MDWAWLESANCKEAETDVFFNYEREAEAREYCKNCPVLDDCLNYALRHEIHGIWGGTDEPQRRVIRKQRMIRVKDMSTVNPSNERCGTMGGVRRHIKLGQTLCSACAVRDEERRTRLRTTRARHKKRGRRK